MTKEYILHFLKEHKEELESKFGIEKMALFGSYAHGNESENSDIDLLVIKMKKKNAFTMLKAKSFLSEYLKKEVDLGLFDSLRPFIKNRIKDELIYV